MRVLFFKCVGGFVKLFVCPGLCSLLGSVACNRARIGDIRTVRCRMLDGKFRCKCLK